jgi:uncharacterized membrane protein YfcA
MTPSLETYLLLCLSALAAGVLNAIAGGGTLLTFPVLLTVVPTSVIANGTSTVALVPGSMAGAWGYRQELQVSRRWLILLSGPCIIGGMVGTLLVTKLHERYFSMLVPWLILLATLLFLAQPALSRLTGIGRGEERPSGLALLGIMLFQFLVAIYGGYFGAGMGILMLSSFGVLGLNNIHRMNALKTILAAFINLVAVAVFAIEGKVVWTYGILMAIAAIIGGYLGARYARRLNPALVRWVVIAIGFALTAYFFHSTLNSTPVTSPATHPPRVLEPGPQLAAHFAQHARGKDGFVPG